MDKMHIKTSTSISMRHKVPDQKLKIIYVDTMDTKMKTLSYLIEIWI